MVGTVFGAKFSWFVFLSSRRLILTGNYCKLCRCVRPWVPLCKENQRLAVIEDSDMENLIHDENLILILAMKELEDTKNRKRRESIIGRIFPRNRALEYGLLMKDLFAEVSTYPPHFFRRCYPTQWYNLYALSKLARPTHHLSLARRLCASMDAESGASLVLKKNHSIEERYWPPWNLYVSAIRVIAYDIPAYFTVE